MRTIFQKNIKRLCTLGVMLIAIPALLLAETVAVFSDNSIPQIKFAANDVKTALESKGFVVEMNELSKLKKGYSNKKVVIALSSNNKVTKLLASEGGTIPNNLGEQAYALQTTNKKQTSYWVIAGDVNGAMYGALQIAENINFDAFTKVYISEVKPNIKNRGAKLNMPFDRRLPTYWGEFTETSAQQAIPHVWDMTFWTTWFDEMARHRYNVVSVWVHNPFPALVHVPEYPLATLPSIEGFNGYKNDMNINQRIEFWRKVIKYAHDRGFKFYFFSWNVCVDYASDQYSSITKKESNPTTIDYVNKSMTALLNTYPELDGYGISAGDHMNGKPEERMSWTWRAYGKAVYDFAIKNPDRKFTVIHRGLSTSLVTVYQYWDSIKTLPNIKFDFSIKQCMAHMYSTLTPKWYESQMDEAAQFKQRTWLTLRNDDFFYLNWGDPKFVRDFIDNIPNKDIIQGFYIGSDVYQPTRSFWYNDASKNGQLEIQRNWYIQQLWGRIAYDRDISDDVFKKYMAWRFRQASSDKLFEAWAKASRPLPKVTELTQADWRLDVHWYPEACIGRKGWKTIAEMMTTNVAKGSTVCNIANSALGKCDGAKSSYQIADEMIADAMGALALIDPMTSGGNPDLEIAINTVKQLAYLSNYYAWKIRGATYKKAEKIDLAREAMGQAYCWWIKYATSMNSMYKTDVFRPWSTLPDWHFADDENLKEYTDLGGVGIPECK